MDYLKEFSEAVKETNQEISDFKRTVLRRVDALEVKDSLSHVEVRAIRELISRGMADALMSRPSNRKMARRSRPGSVQQVSA